MPAPRRLTDPFFGEQKQRSIADVFRSQAKDAQIQKRNLFYIGAMLFPMNIDGLKKTQAIGRISICRVGRQR